MRRSKNLSLAFTLVLVAMLGYVPGALAKQDATPQAIAPGAISAEVEGCDPKSEANAPWEGVCRPFAVELTEDEVPEIPGAGPLQPFVTVFKQADAATVPVFPDAEAGLSAEFMVVYVKQGKFALDIYEDTPGSVLASTWRDSFQELRYNDNADPRSEHSEYTDDGAPFYTEIGDYKVNTSDAEPCTTACPIEPGRAIQLEAGDVAIAEAGAICVYCLIVSAEDPPPGEVPGILHVFVLQNPGDSFADFSWIRSWDSPSPGAERLDPTTTNAWSMFNPGTRCRGH
jgi:hypothetical protein